MWSHQQPKKRPSHRRRRYSPRCLSSCTPAPSSSTRRKKPAPSLMRYTRASDASDGWRSSAFPNPDRPLRAPARQPTTCATTLRVQPTERGLLTSFCACFAGARIATRRKGERPTLLSLTSSKGKRALLPPSAIPSRYYLTFTRRLYPVESLQPSVACAHHCCSRPLFLLLLQLFFASSLLPLSRVWTYYCLRYDPSTTSGSPLHHPPNTTTASLPSQQWVSSCTNPPPASLRARAGTS